MADGAAAAALNALLAREEFQLLHTSPTGRAYRELLCPRPDAETDDHRPDQRQPEFEPGLNVEPEPEPRGVTKTDDGTEFIAERMLRARGGNVDAAAALLQTILKFRERYRLPNVNDPATIELWNRLLPLLPVGFSSVPAACGSVVEVWDVGKAWIAEIISFCPDREELVRAYLYHIECGQRAQHDAALAQGLPHVQQQIMICNLAGLAARHVAIGCVSTVVELLRVAETHYPDNMRRVIIVNAPTMFASVWSVVSAVLSEETARKVTVCADDGLESIIDAVGGLERVPTVFGGNAPIQLGIELGWPAPGVADHSLTVGARDELVLAKDLAWLRRHGLTDQRKYGASHESALNESAELGSSPEHCNEWISVRFSSIDYPIAFKAEWTVSCGDDSAQPDTEMVNLLEGMADWKVAAPLNGKYLCQVIPHDVLLRVPVSDGRGVVRLTFANDFLMTAVKLWHNWME